MQRRALHKVKPEDVEGLRPGSVRDRAQFARQVTEWLKDEPAQPEGARGAARYAAWATLTPEGKAKHRAGVLFKAPRKLDFMRLVPVHTENRNGVREHMSWMHLRQRDGFALTDQGTDLVGALDQANYCIWCHEQGKDSCSKGLKEKAPAEGFRKTVFGVPLAGCPLEEKISEFHMVKARGEPLAALGIIAVDNPMVAATGHRICNDCMKSCIYQKQEPVDIPQAETRTLKDVLELPWGFEIYSLLTRWNPVRPAPALPARICRKKSTGRRPRAGGLHRGAPPDERRPHGGRHRRPEDRAARGRRFLVWTHWATGSHSSPSRTSASCASRWIVAPWPASAASPSTASPCAGTRTSSRSSACCSSGARQFAMFGGVRFGGTLTIDEAFADGFDHIALCAGAGRPTVLEIPNGFARGVRAASDFLMALQLTGAAKRESIANLQIRLPIVVIGGGLTAIDTATESLAYYAVQVEKFLARYEALEKQARVEPGGARDRRGVHCACAGSARRSPSTASFVCCKAGAA